MNPWDKQKQEAKEDPKPEKKVPVPAGEAVPRNVLVSDLDAFILDRVASQPRTIDEIDVKVLEKQVAGRHRLSLPDEMTPYQKKYAFCWIFKRKQAIDEACDLWQWTLCNRNYFPDLPNHLFTANGVIERGDNILAFRTHAIDEEMRRAPGFESTQRLKSRIDAHKGDASYYTPEDGYEINPQTGKLEKIPVVGI